MKEWGRPSQSSWAYRIGTPLQLPQTGNISPEEINIGKCPYKQCIAGLKISPSPFIYVDKMPTFRTLAGTMNTPGRLPLQLPWKTFTRTIPNFQEAKVVWGEYCHGWGLSGELSLGSCPGGNYTGWIWVSGHNLSITIRSQYGGWNREVLITPPWLKSALCHNSNQLAITWLNKFKAALLNNNKHSINTE